MIYLIKILYQNQIIIYKKKNDPLIVFDNCNDYYSKKYGTIGYRKIYGDIINQQQSKKEAELSESILENTPTNERKVPDFTYKFKPEYTGDYSLLDDFRKQKICKKIMLERYASAKLV